MSTTFITFFKQLKVQEPIKKCIECKYCLVKGVTEKCTRVIYTCNDTDTDKNECNEKKSGSKGIQSKGIQFEPNIKTLN